MPVAPASLVLPGRFRAAVFDMDGLLLDTEPLWHDAERELLERHGDTFSDADLEASHGRALVDTAAVYAERLGLPADAIEREIGEIMLAHYVAGAPLHAGVRELVDALDGRIALAVASNTSADLVRQALDAVGLSALGVVVSGQDLGRPKPAPDVYVAACRALGVAPARRRRVRGLADGRAVGARRPGCSWWACPSGRTWTSPRPGRTSCWSPWTR